MKKNIFRIIIIILLIGTFYIIFGFSSQTGEQSSGISKKITNSLVKHIKYVQEKPEIEKEKIISRIETIIRKVAHFSIYMVVGVLLMSLVSTYDLKNKVRIAISLISGILYAISDEIHQSFTPRKKSNDNRCNY